MGGNWGALARMCWCPACRWWMWSPGATAVLGWHLCLDRTQGTQPPAAPLRSQGCTKVARTSTTLLLAAAPHLSRLRQHSTRGNDAWAVLLPAQQPFNSLHALTQRFCPNRIPAAPHLQPWASLSQPHLARPCKATPPLAPAGSPQQAGLSRPASASQLRGLSAHLLTRWEVCIFGVLAQPAG